MATLVFNFYCGDINLNNPFAGLNKKLTKTDDELRSCFKELISFEDVAKLLEVPQHVLWITLVKNKPYNYQEVSIPKKNGGSRTVYISSSSLFILQKKLKYILELMYNHHSTSHGFIKEKSILTNATRHVGKKYVMNVDLKDFFPTIRYERIVNMFVKVFKCNLNVAHALANIVTHHEGFLPQGSPISPLISNIIARSMDDQILKLCKEVKEIQYTRYADDLTFSTNRKVVPTSLARFTGNTYEISNTLLKIIESNGFKVNMDKFRIQSEYEHQSVTGIKVNQKLNVNKSYIRNIRLYLHLFEKHSDLNEAISEFNKRRPRKTRFKITKKTDIQSHQIYHLRILKGMIEFVGAVKGRRDKVFSKFARRFNLICENADYSTISINIPLLLEEVIDSKILLVGNNDRFYYTLNEGISINEMTLPNSLAVYNKNKGIISSQMEWANFANTFSGTHYYEFYTIPIYDRDGQIKIVYSKLTHPKGDDLITFEHEMHGMDKLYSKQTDIGSLITGAVILVGLHNNIIEFFEGNLTKRSIFKESHYIFKASHNENLPIKFGFVFNQNGLLIGVLKREESELIVKEIFKE